MALETLEKTATEDSSIENQVKQDDITKQFFVFKLGEEEYCVDLPSVKEIKSWTNVTHLPNSPNYMKGVINLRGMVIPILDLKKKFGLGETDPTRKSVVIILNVNERLIGALADEASEILTVKNSQINPLPELETVNFVSGLIQKGEIMVILLDIQKIFDLKTLDEANELAGNFNKTVTFN